MDVELVIAKAQEQFHLAKEVQQCENCLRHWAEQLVKVWVTEVSGVRALDRTAVERALEWAVGRNSRKEEGSEGGRKSSGKSGLEKNGREGGHRGSGENLG